MVLVTAAPGLKCSVAKGREVGWRWEAAAVGSCLIPAAAWAGWSLQMLLDWQSAGESCFFWVFLVFFFAVAVFIALDNSTTSSYGCAGESAPQHELKPLQV